VAVVVASGGYAYAATNTVASSNAGAGSGLVSGYTVSDLAYIVDSSAPTNLDEVTFAIAPVGTSTIKIQLAPAGSWYRCTNAAGSVSCNTTSPQATVATTTQLTVVAAE
jgi:hypothetical protein